MRGGALRHLVGLALVLASPALWGVAAADVLFTVGPGPDVERLPLVTQVKVEGARRSEQLRVEILTRPLLDQPAEPERIDEVLRSMSERHDVSAYDVDVEEAGQTATVTFRSMGSRMLVEGILLDTEPDDGKDPDAETNARRLRQIQAGDHPLLTLEGQPFHNYWLRRDVESVRRVFVEDGFLDAQVIPELRRSGELVEVVFQVAPGAQYSTGAITRDVTDKGLRKAVRAVPLKVERGAPAPESLRADAHSIRRAVCLAGGYPDASVDVEVGFQVQERPVVFTVHPGPQRRVRSIVFTHQSLPPRFLAEHGLTAGAPFCPDTLLELEQAIRVRLRDEGFPDPEISLSPRALPPEEQLSLGEERVDVVLQVKPRIQAVIQRVWFDGNTVTQRQVLRSMVVVRDGDVFSQTAIDRSVQNLLRSGLFRRAYARVIDGGGGRYYLYFIVREREFLSLSFQHQEVTFYNMDLYTAPAGLGEVTDGVTLRGRGHLLAVRAKKDHQRVRFRDPFLFQNAVTRLDLDHRVFGFEALEETVWSATLGLGLRAFENRLEIVPVVSFESLDTSAPARYRSLPVRGDDDFRMPWGVETSVDLRLVDAERFPYLGALLEGSAINVGLPGSGKADVLRLKAAGRFFAPLGRNRTGQRFVVEAYLEGQWRLISEEDRLTAFERTAPEIRGFDREAHYLPHEVVSTDAEGRMVVEQVMLGGTEAYVGSLGIRMPLFNQRRTALVPFVDAITMGDPRVPVFQEVYTGVGMQLRFSMFKERLEGFIYIAYPLRDSPEADYFGSGAGGSF